MWASYMKSFSAVISNLGSVLKHVFTSTVRRRSIFKLKISRRIPMKMEWWLHLFSQEHLQRWALWQERLRDVSGGIVVRLSSMAWNPSNYRVQRSRMRSVEIRHMVGTSSENSIKSMKLGDAARFAVYFERSYSLGSRVSEVKQKNTRHNTRRWRHRRKIRCCESQFICYGWVHYVVLSHAELIWCTAGKVRTKTLMLYRHRESFSSLLIPFINAVIEMGCNMDWWPMLHQHWKYSQQSLLVGCRLEQFVDHQNRDRYHLVTFVETSSKFQLHNLHGQRQLS